MDQAPVFLAWHYTTGARFLQILKRRAIVPAPVSDTSLGRPVIWFSVNEQFDPSACTITRESDGSLHHLTVNETADQGLGLVRLGVPVRTLLTCGETRRKAGMPINAWETLCEEAQELGSDPDQWFGCLQPIPLGNVVVEVLDEDGCWRRMQGATAGRNSRPSRRTEGLGSHHLLGR
jgi:hypothetical protein